MNMITHNMQLSRMTSPIPERNFMENHTSYHGCISGGEAIKRLKKTHDVCTYVTRFSTSHRRYVITILKRGRPNTVGHFRLNIDRSAQRKYSVDGLENHFDSIDELLGFYEKNRIHPEFDTIGRQLTKQHYDYLREKGICTLL